MTDQLGDANELAKRLVACKHWRWMPGMLAQSESQGAARIYYVGHDGWISLCGGYPHSATFHAKRLEYPILSDPATVGCILALVREAWGDQQAYAIGFRQDVSWTVTLVSPVTDEQFWFDGATEVEALLAALEAAP